MAQKLTMKFLSEELEVLRNRVQELEQQLERKLEATLEAAAGRLRSRIEASEPREHGTSIGAEERQRMIAEEAYLIAERRGFQGGDPSRDWAEAEILVNHRLMLQESPQATEKETITKPAAKKSTASGSSRRK